MNRLLGRIRATDGVVVILGNHDYNLTAPRSMRTQSGDAVANGVARTGVAVFRNESLRITREKAGLQIARLDDYWTGNFDVNRAFAHVNGADPVIALCHNPDGFPELLGTPAQWTLAGHTHGGQVRLPFVGPLFLPVRHREFSAGHYQRSGRHLYVNRGLGWLSRVRFNARPEITLFDFPPRKGPGSSVAEPDAGYVTHSLSEHDNARLRHQAWRRTSFESIQ